MKGKFLMATTSSGLENPQGSSNNSSKKIQEKQKVEIILCEINS